ncbi:MAG: polymerase sigma factor FliA [Planctomycetota bacterium]|jgi:RNA polymerase sigma factor for flagellar operon FliA
MVSNGVHGVSGRLRGRKSPNLKQASILGAAVVHAAPSGGASLVAGAERAGEAAMPQPVGTVATHSGAEPAPSRIGRREVVARSLTDESTEVLLARYRARTNDTRARFALRDELVERHRAIVESMAHLMAAKLPPSVDPQDLVHAGIWGLMQAIDSYQPELCDQFTAFLRIRVRGSMLDELRHMDFLPRLFRRRLREREAARSRLSMALEREPTASELAAELGISEVALLRRFEPSLLCADRGSDRGEEPDQGELIVDSGEESPIEAIHRQDLLNLVRAHLEPIEWKVLQLHYLEGMTGKQVARRLRLSAARICQIHGRVLDRLKAQLAEGDSA